ncbi:hypothetical protein TWF788_010388 [Orbilia oligospora]|uniref:G-patch domain-containing protein n=1 Tax=Orbilia oligospora TaxID=2813651 RepID=A0A7C8P8T1_ORBOL|nr:hypothetical protein TWF788_010388 [Orbilia oligospora]
MNAQSYLQSFGWTPGTSLGNPLSHAPSTSTCPSSQRLTKRILISTKNNTLGVGRKQSNLNHADLWWEKAFDVSLKKLDVNKDTSSIPQEKKDVVDNMNLFSDLGGGRGFGGTAIGEGAKKGGGKKVEHSKAPLYRYFTETTILKDSRPNKKRKRDSDNDKDKDTSSLSRSERKALKSERKQLRAERRAAKTERRRLRTERRAAKEEKRKLKAEKRAKKEAKKEAKKAESSSTSSDDEEEEEEEEEEEKHVQSDSGVDMSQDEASVEEDAVTEGKGKGKDKKKATKALKETGVDAKKKEKKSDRKAKDGSKKKKEVSST